MRMDRIIEVCVFLLIFAWLLSALIYGIVGV